MKFFDLEMNHSLTASGTRGGRDVSYKHTYYSDCMTLIYTHGNSYETCYNNAYRNPFQFKCWRHYGSWEEELE